MTSMLIWQMMFGSVSNKVTQSMQTCVLKLQTTLLAMPPICQKGSSYAQPLLLNDRGSLIGKGKTLEEADSSGNFSEYWKIKPMAGSTTNHSESNFQKIGGFNISQSCLCIRAEYQNTNTYYIVSLKKSNLLLLLYLDDKVRKTLE